MTDSLNAVEDWAAHLLHRLTAPERRQMLRTLAQTLRRSQQQRLAAQRNPDGTPFAPRKARTLRARQGTIRQQGKMFQKIRLARHLKASVQGDGAALGYTGRVAKIARTHQYGLRAAGEIPAAAGAGVDACRAGDDS
jgi:phage virion morphogenesis protein